jgi:hypothetical protein
MRSRGVATLAAMVALLAGTARVSLYAQQTALETRLKAAILSKLPQFVEWPSQAVVNRPSLDLCVIGDDAMAADLHDLVSGETIGGLPMAVRSVAPDDNVDHCHVLFVSAQRLAGTRAAVRRASSQPVLTVSDDERFLDYGGIVRIRDVDGRLRFDINAGAARRAGLRISAQLLQLAAIVRDGPE